MTKYFLLMIFFLVLTIAGLNMTAQGLAKIMGIDPEPVLRFVFNERVLGVKLLGHGFYWDRPDWLQLLL